MVVGLRAKPTVRVTRRLCTPVLAFLRSGLWDLGDDRAILLRLGIGWFGQQGPRARAREKTVASLPKSFLSCLIVVAAITFLQGRLSDNAISLPRKGVPKGAVNANLTR